MKQVVDGVNILGKTLAVIATAIGVSGSVAYASVRILGLETKIVHEADVRTLRSEQSQESRILRGMIECVLRDIAYERCPAVRADLERGR